VGRLNRERRGGLARMRLWVFRRRGSRGYILLDVITAMAVALVGLVVLMGSLSTLGRIAARQAARVHSVVEQRNADAQDRAVSFQGK
jgi:hypothetical protein